MKSSINCVEIKNLTRSQCTFAKCCLMRTGQILNTFFILRLAYWTVERNTIIITMSEWFSKTHWYFQVLYVIYTMNQNHIFFFYFCDTRNWGNTKVSIFLIMEGLYWLTDNHSKFQYERTLYLLRKPFFRRQRTQKRC